jgi:hypothetical protein
MILPAEYRCVYTFIWIIRAVNAVTLISFTLHYPTNWLSLYVEFNIILSDRWSPLYLVSHAIILTVGWSYTDSWKQGVEDNLFI